MKTCSKCKRELDRSLFPSNKSKKDGLGYHCLECQREYTRAHYKGNKKYYLDKATRNTKEFKDKIRAIKEASPCTDCGVKYPYYVMDFDHLEDKVDNSSRMMVNGNLRKITEEIAKCDVVCSNCHRVRTHERSAPP